MAEWLFGKHRFGHVFSTVGTGMQPEFAGQGARKFDNVLAVAKGGTLFIDEGYGMSSGKMVL
jgi:hypothetical protein